MGILGSIMSAIFGAPKAASAPAAGGSAAAAPAARSGSAASASTAPKPMTRDQVEAMIQAIADKSGHKDYNWKQSIVDLMKLLNLDSSLNARKQLAQELGYTGRSTAPRR